MIPRDYQLDAVRNTFEQFATNDSTLGTLPTGLGKTVVFSMVARDFPQRVQQGRTLILAHREELIWQAAQKIERITGDKPEIEMGENTAARHGLLAYGNVVVSSVQTQNAGRKCSCQAHEPGVEPPPGCQNCLDGMVRRMQRFDPKEFSLIITDEAHHSTAATYGRIYDHYMGANPSIKHLGVTATPDRSDEEALGRRFQSVAFEMDILDGINGGWLVPINQSWVQVEGLDLSNVRTTAGDLNEGELADILEQEEQLHGIVSPTLELAGDRPTLVFATTVAHAQLMCDIINRHRPGQAICVHGKTPKDERRRLLAEYAQGRYQYLCGCGVFLEGFDEPRIACVAMARPTKSRSLYAQAIGRGTRPILPPLEPDPRARRDGIAFGPKPDLLVLDFVGNSGKHKLISTADILGGRYTDDVVAEAVRIAKSKGGAQNLSDTFQEAATALEAAKREKIRLNARYALRNISPFDLFETTPGIREPGWHKGRPPTPRQLEALRKFGVDIREVKSFFQATKLLDGAIARIKEKKSSFRQVRCLAKFGIDGREMSSEQAGQRITQLAGATPVGSR